MKRLGAFLIAILLTLPFTGKSSNNDWTKDVGAQSFPDSKNTLSVNEFDANKGGLILATKAIQTAIDSCAAMGGGKVVFEPGMYLTGALFVKNNVNLHIGKDVELRGVIGLEYYPDIDTRVAGIEMEWPAAIINIIDQQNAAVTGKGTIHGQGRYHWERYWQLREEYTPKGLRWASDYDCKRVRTVLVSNSKDVTISDLTMLQAGFWTVHVLYSDHVTVDGLIINNNIGGHGPSTDGVDIDSSSKILVQNCDIDCNDDNICLKAGRDADGIRVNRPTEYVVIRNCISRHGGGLITFGSETSGEIRYVEVYNLQANNTNCAIRLKSALTRGGGVSNVNIYNIEMNNVRIPVEVTLNWNPSYSYASLEEEMGKIPDYWKVMLEEVPAEKGIPLFKNVSIKNVNAKGSTVALHISGIEDSYIQNFSWEDINIESERPGHVKYTKNWSFKNFNVKSKNGQKVEFENNIDMQISNSDM
ncbi:MAG: glycosyl hydrolase family 28 protein [Prolixibacteraceae bacterium]|jgi:polygalacturonase|nr:glycosyl hydrolase family 28 protein [Prolixibacteraceae bacterium]